jgi:hypothetical protein
MKKVICGIIVVLMGFSVTGCFYQRVDKTDLLRAEYFCEGRLGVKDILVDFLGNETVTCVNGELSNLRFVKYKLLIVK